MYSIAVQQKKKQKQIQCLEIKMSSLRDLIREKKRIVVKIGSSSLTHKQTSDMDYIRMEKLAVSYTHLTLPTICSV